MICRDIVRPGMEFLVNLPQPLMVDVGINLRGPDIDVASISCTLRKSAPPLSRCVAKQ